MLTTDKPAGRKLRGLTVIALVLVIMAVAVAVPPLAGRGLSSCEEKCGAWNKCDIYESGSWEWYWCKVSQNWCQNFTWDCVFP